MSRGMTNSHNATGKLKKPIQFGVGNNAAYAEQVADRQGFVGAVGAVVGAVVGAPIFCVGAVGAVLKGFEFQNPSKRLLRLLRKK